jgi:hypothetical protein
VHVVEAGGVLENVDQAHRLFDLPGVVDGDVGRQLADRRIEIDLAVFV